MLNLLDEFSIDELKTTEVKYLDLERQKWNFSRGAKTTREYLCENGSKAIEISYAYTYSNDLRDIESVTRHIEMFDSSGNMFFDRDITKPLNVTQIGDLNEEIRRGRVHYLREAAKDLPSFSPFVPEPYKTDFLRGPSAVELLNRYYRDEMSSYMDSNTLDFENAILSESNTLMLEALNLNVRPPDVLFPTGLTIKQSIIHQLTGVV